MADYIGIRDLTNPDQINEEDIVSEDGVVLGVKNRVRAGLATFQNPQVLQRRNLEENKVMVYTTSFRGVRSTFEDCKYVLSIFHNYRVKIDERDVYVHQHFHHELEERLGGKRMNLPQVFINGQHIGNKQEVDELNEIGEIKKLLENIPRIDIQKNCTECGGFGLVPCTKCNGSKNSVANSFTSEFRALKCTACNENGLQPCQKCN